MSKNASGNMPLDGAHYSPESIVPTASWLPESFRRAAMLHERNGHSSERGNPGFATGAAPTGITDQAQWKRLHLPSILYNKTRSTSSCRKRRRSFRISQTSYCSAMVTLPTLSSKVIAAYMAQSGMELMRSTISPQ